MIRPATESEILEELALVSTRFPGRLPLKTAQVWAKDLIRHEFNRIDLMVAGDRLADRIDSPDRPEWRRGRLDLSDMLEEARSARRDRMKAEELERAAPPSKQIAGPKFSDERRPKLPLAAAVVFSSVRLKTVDTEIDPEACDRLFRRAMTLPLAELRAWKEQLEAECAKIPPGPMARALGTIWAGKKPQPDAPPPPPAPRPEPEPDPTPTEPPPLEDDDIPF